MKIRQAEKTDYKKLMQLFNLFMEKSKFYKHHNDSFHKVLTDPKCLIFVAEEKSELVGFITFRSRYVVRYLKPIGQVEELFVLKNFRKQGVGKNY